MQRKAVSEGGVLVGMSFTCFLILKTLGLELLSVSVTMILFAIYLIRNKKQGLLFVLPYSILVFVTCPIYEVLIYSFVPLFVGYIGYKSNDKEYRASLIVITIVLFVFTLIALLIDSFITNINMEFIQNYMLKIKNIYSEDRLKSLGLMMIGPGFLIIVLSYSHINAQIYCAVLSRYTKRKVTQSNKTEKIVLVPWALAILSTVLLAVVERSIYLDFAMILLLMFSLYSLICIRFWKTLNRRALKD